MPTFEAEITIEAPAADLFALTQDYGCRLDWDPFLTEARLVGTHEVGVGARAYCAAWYGVGMETEYVSYDPPRTAAVRMTRGPALLESFAGSWRFQPAGEGATRVVFRYHVEAHPRWLRFLFDPICQVVFRRDTEKRLEALKRFVEARGVRSR